MSSIAHLSNPKRRQMWQIISPEYWRNAAGNFAQWRFKSKRGPMAALPGAEFGVRNGTFGWRLLKFLCVGDKF